MTSFVRPLATLLGVVCFNLALLNASVSAATELDCAPPPESAQAQPTIAVSLSRFEAELEHCQAANSCGEELTWHGMTRVYGYIVDRTHNDIVFYGGSDPDAAPLRVDDFVIAVRSADHKYVERRGNTLVYEDPGVTIDPQPAVLRRLDQIMQGPADDKATERRMQAWCTNCELPQNVRVLGIGADSDSHFGMTAFAGDFLMKSISNGLKPVDGLQSLSDAAMQMAVERIENGSHDGESSSQLNRFWFVAGPTNYVADGDTTELSRADVVLKTEAELVSGQGISGTGRADPLAAGFACAFSRVYPQLAQPDSPYPVYAELEALFRWVAIAHLLVEGEAFDAAGYRPDYLIDAFKVPRVAVPHNVKGVAHVGRWENVENNGTTRRTVKLRLPSCGGVDLGVARKDMLAVADADERLPQVSDAVTSSRPSPEAVWWAVQM
jgi:hypothetical protein